MRYIYCEFLKQNIYCNSFVKFLQTNEKMRLYYIDKLNKETLNEFNRALSVSLNTACKYLYKVIINKCVYCKYSKQIIPFEKTIKGHKTLNKKYELWGKGVSTRGKKRKEVGLKISKSLKGKPKSEEHREKMSERLRSIDFKKRVLDNKNIKYKNDEDALKQYFNFYSEQRKSIGYKRKYCKNAVETNMYEGFLDFNDSIDDLSEDGVFSLFSEIMSIKSTLAMMENPTMGIGQPTYIDGLKYNKNNINEICVRSGMEKNIIMFLENNCIFWDYEQCIINYFLDFSRSYIIDFFIYDNQEKIPLEVKGAIRSTDVDKNIAKINSAIEKFGKIILYQGEKLFNKNDLLALIVDKKDSFNFKHAYQV